MTAATELDRIYAMVPIAKRLYELLPAIHRIRDAERGYPLLELVAVIAEQVAAMEENLDQLYDDQFIETCAPWVAPYIGDLIGYHGLHGVVSSVASPRADVANTIRYRRRKGTASMLEQMARDVTGWPARAVEFFQLLGWTQYMNHLRADAHYAPDMRDHERLHWRDTAFDTIAHTVDVRNISVGAARPNIPNIGIYLWRVRAYPLTRSPAADAGLGGGALLRFNPLGTDMALYNTPQTEAEISHLAEPVNVPMPLARRWLAEHLGDYYGPGKSLFLERGRNPSQPIPAEDICVCDLSDIEDGGGSVTGWAHQPVSGSGKVAIDPVLGRIAFGDAPAKPIMASFQYGFTTDISGGEYERGELPAPADQSVQQGTGLQTALDAVKDGGTLEVIDSDRYAETPTITVNDGKTVVVRAKNGARPLLLAGGDVVLTVGEGATLILDGLIVDGGTLAIGGDKACKVILRDCTLVPSAARPGLTLTNPFATLEMERCITGSLCVAQDASALLTECIVDATKAVLAAYRGPDDDLHAGGALSLDRCTVVGKVHARELSMVSDSIFEAALDTDDAWKAPVWAERRQIGCVRFSYVPPGSRTPRRYECQPKGGDASIWPQFTSLRYGDPGYCQLHQVTPVAIRRGADDESEMGVLHDLYQPQRETNLQVRLEEYLRFGLKAGLIYAS